MTDTPTGYNVEGMSLEKKGACHSAHLKQLNRVEGQIRGISKMIEEQRYCVDILTQIKAAKSALGSIEKKILQEHLNHCVHEAIESRNKKQANEMLEEINTLFKNARLS